MKKWPSTSRTQEGFMKGVEAEAAKAIADKAKRKRIFDDVIQSLLLFQKFFLKYNNLIFCQV